MVDNEEKIERECPLCRTFYQKTKISKLIDVESNGDGTGDAVFDCLTEEERGKLTGLPDRRRRICKRRSVCRMRQMYYNESFEDNKILATIAPDL